MGMYRTAEWGRILTVSVELHFQDSFKRLGSHTYWDFQGKIILVSSDLKLGRFAIKM